MVLLETVPDARLQVGLFVELGHMQKLFDVNFFVVNGHELLPAEVPENENEQNLGKEVEDHVKQCAVLSEQDQV